MFTKIILACGIISILSSAPTLVRADSGHDGSSSATVGDLQASQDGQIRRCADVVKHCFAISDTERSNCYYDASQSASCKDSELGSLIYRRWAMAPSQPQEGEPPPAFLGPQLVDQICLNNFDSQFSSDLVSGEPSIEKLRQLDERLGRCTKQLPIDLTRP